MNKKYLTPEQYSRTNRAMALILTLCYIVYDVIDITNMLAAPGTDLFGLLRVLLYLAVTISIHIMARKQGDKKSTMLYMAITFTIAYALFVFGNGVGSMVLVFPALIGFMIYLNSNLVIIGFVFAFIICAVKTFTFKMAGNEVMNMK